MMLKPLFILLLIFAPLQLLSQDVDRVKISGKVSAPSQEDIEGVSIYNISSQHGAITKADGSFEIEVAENDRVSVTALQFSTFTVIVDKGVIENQRMGIYLNPVVNVLEEVIVRPYDLSGNIIADVTKVKTINLDSKMDLSYETLNFEYEFSDDQYSAIRGNAAHEAFYNGQEQYGGNLIGLVGGIVTLIFPKKDIPNIRRTATDTEALSRGLQQRFSNDYIAEHFNVPVELANDFIYYAEENGMKYEYLYARNEMVLLDFMLQKSEEYNSIREEK